MGKVLFELPGIAGAGLTRINRGFSTIRILAFCIGWETG
jgi:hypothetical protein